MEVYGPTRCLVLKKCMAALLQLYVPTLCNYGAMLERVRGKIDEAEVGCYGHLYAVSGTACARSLYCPWETRVLHLCTVLDTRVQCEYGSGRERVCSLCTAVCSLCTAVCSLCTADRH